MTIPYPSNSESIFCQICGKPFQKITPLHLKIHNISIEQYRTRYPDADLVSESSKRKLSNSLLNLYGNKKKLDQNSDEEVVKQSLDTDEVIVNEEINIEELEPTVEEVKIDEETFNLKKYDSENMINRSKEEILDLLLTFFSNIEVDYLIRKLTPTNNLVYEYITDFCDPVLKVIIDFPDAFFHNVDRYVNLSRDTMLEQDGWKIIKIKNISDIEEEVKNKIY